MSDAHEVAKILSDQYGYLAKADGSFLFVELPDSERPEMYMHHPALSPEKAAAFIDQDMRTER